MSIAGKLFGIWALSRVAAPPSPAFMPVLAGVAAIILCVVFCAFLCVLITGAGAWSVYHALLSGGVSVADSVLIVLWLLAALLLAVMAVMQYYLKRVRLAMRYIFSRQSPVVSCVTDLVDSFLQGYNSPSRTR